MPKCDGDGFLRLLVEHVQRVYGRVGLGSVVLDAGANIGDFTRSALDDGARLVVAIEIDPDLIACLRRTFSAEIRAGRVVVYPKGVWDKDEYVTMARNPGQNSGMNSVVFQSQGPGENVRVPLTTIDEIVAELRLDRVDFIKLDVEGAELRGLRGGRETIRRHHPRIAVDSEAFSREELREVPRLIGAFRPDYKMICGPCSDLRTRVRVDVVRFE